MKLLLLVLEMSDYLEGIFFRFAELCFNKNYFQTNKQKYFDSNLLSKILQRFRKTYFHLSCA